MLFLRNQDVELPLFISYERIHYVMHHHTSCIINSMIIILLVFMLQLSLDYYVTVNGTSKPNDFIHFSNTLDEYMSILSLIWLVQLCMCKVHM